MTPAHPKAPSAFQEIFIDCPPESAALERQTTVLRKADPSNAATAVVVILPSLRLKDHRAGRTPSTNRKGGSACRISRVTWTQHPTPMYRAVAAANGVDSGAVTLSCMVEADGRASGCTVLTETPEGQGFGQAALASMERARFSPATLATATAGVRARFTVRFRLAE